MKSCQHRLLSIYNLFRAGSLSTKNLPVTLGKVQYPTKIRGGSSFNLSRIGIGMTGNGIQKNKKPIANKELIKVYIILVIDS